MMRRTVLGFFVVALACVGWPASAAPARQFVLSPEGNNLWAYDAGTGAPQLVIHAVNGSTPAHAPPGSDRRDINGQICVSPDRTHFISGEDTVLGDGDSHDPRIAGWGWFRITGSTLGTITAHQEGKLAPEAGSGPGYRGDPDNYGCGFLDANRLVTTAIGNTLPGEPANGQLFLWFGPFDAGYREENGFFAGEVDHCEVDSGLATAGGIAVAPNGDVYVATNRPRRAAKRGVALPRPVPCLAGRVHAGVPPRQRRSANS